MGVRLRANGHRGSGAGRRMPERSMHAVGALEAMARWRKGKPERGGMREARARPGVEPSRGKGGGRHVERGAAAAATAAADEVARSKACGLRGWRRPSATTAGQWTQPVGARRAAGGGEARVGARARSGLSAGEWGVVITGEDATGAGSERGEREEEGVSSPHVAGEQAARLEVAARGETRVRSGDVAPAAGSRAASASRRGGGHRGGDEEASETR
nr:uncharacterized protein LOC109778815 [Aegilops tauschii subsp. strangulata]